MNIDPVSTGGEEGCNPEKETTVKEVSILSAIPVLDALNKEIRATEQKLNQQRVEAAILTVELATMHNPLMREMLALAGQGFSSFCQKVNEYKNLHEQYTLELGSSFPPSCGEIKLLESSIASHEVQSQPAEKLSQTENSQNVVHQDSSQLQPGLDLPNSSYGPIIPSRADPQIGDNNSSITFHSTELTAGTCTSTQEEVDSVVKNSETEHIEATHVAPEQSAAHGSPRSYTENRNHILDNLVDMESALNNTSPTQGCQRPSAEDKNDSG